jgi:hypothetical protein
VHVGDLRITDAHPLSARSIDEPSGGIPRRVAEHAAGAAAGRLVLATPTQMRGDTIADLSRIVRHEPHVPLSDHVGGPQRGPPIRVVEIRHVQPSPVARGQLDHRRLRQHVRYRSRVGACVHPYGATESGRYLGSELESRESQPSSEPSGRRQIDGSAEAEPPVFGVVKSETAPEPDGDAAEPVV